ncbi:cyclic nucleotide-gated olfactory channel [Elysia marginata]|uniref:Cyclic nucleotide-gated olfactory channel n=1 Tax=Elysia marginata TaxID=1093978 RepID=A0AAV4GTU1_9GAST|nr:cyclic nucleotide-gated olfactory channel [Elysia marginata]
MASSSLSRDRLTDKRACADDDLENGGLSPQPSLRTNPQEDDICSEIVRIEQRDSQDERSVAGLGDEDGTAFSRIVRTLQTTVYPRLASTLIRFNSNQNPWHSLGRGGSLGDSGAAAVS